ncbi:hypothetical protein KH5H1_74320 [Corallococcus caeni]|nr:hypothetical protein KH5H1_74320 [Corallococcus sp. KH5-1]GMU10217.1 hypothetical protein ASNO1_64710 [Corallococcus sp. NO1]
MTMTNRLAVSLTCLTLLSAQAALAAEPQAPAAKPGATPAAPAAKPGANTAAPAAPTAAPPAGAAQQGPPPGLPQPSPLLAQLKDFEGKWKCSGTRVPMPGVPAYPIETTWTGKKDLSGFWVSIRLEEKKTAKNQFPVVGDYALGFDPGSGQLLALWHDNFGGRSEQLSTGWQGDTFTWVGEYNMGGMKSGARGVFHRKSAKEMSHTGEANIGGQWVVMVEETCKR